MEDKIFFTTPDGLKLCGILSTPGTPVKKCIILCHGISVDKDEEGAFILLAKELIGSKFAVFRFDFRGHGDSEGNSIDMTIKKEVLDVKAAFGLLQKKGFKEFGLLGASFGGGTVALFTASHPESIKALALWNPLLDYKNLWDLNIEYSRKYWGDKAYLQERKNGFTLIGSRSFKIGKNFLEEKKTLKPWKKLFEIKIPVLFIHGDKDVYVPFQDSVKFGKMIAAEVKIINGARHGFHDDPELEKIAIKNTVDFFKKNLKLDSN